MEIVIDIPEEDYNRIMGYKDIIHKRKRHTLEEAVVNGIPLPKGHGNLIDANEFNKYLISRDSSFKSMLSGIPTIIEADGGAE